MYDLRNIKLLDLEKSECLKEDTTYKFKDSVTGKKLIAKFISYYDDNDDNYLITEFRKLALLSGEPEIATVYYLADGKTTKEVKSCYIMEYIDGSTLREFLNSRSSIIYEVASDLIMQLSSGLEKAHNYEIYHSDLHNENIIIDKFGYLKLIDFLWWDYNLPKKTNLEKDLTDFKDIANQLFEKCKEKDKLRFSYIHKYCSNINTFKGLKKEIELIDELSFDLTLLDQESIKILSKLFQLTGDDYKINKILRITEGEIPKALIPELTEKEKFYIDKIEEGKSKLKYLDTRISKINDNLKFKIDTKLHSLKHSNLINWKMWVTNIGLDFKGPYQLNYDLSFTSKFFKWKKTNDYIQLIDIETTDIEELIIR